MDKRNLTPIAKILRRRTTDAEDLLWSHLRSKQLEGLKFRRQQPIGNYITDFVCFANKLIVEVDGGQHAENKSKDTKRDKDFKNQGYRVLRFWNNEVLSNIEGALETIRSNCITHPPLHPLPSREGKER